jgi:hypothetical protein
MSKYLLSLLTLLAFFSKETKAQHPYIPIPDSAIYITQIEDWWEGQNQPHTFYYDVGYFWDIDTMINNKKYMCYYEAQCNQLPYSGGTTAEFGVWLHQDTIAKKIWWVQDQSNLQGAFLLYDFSLEVGDSITANNHIYFRPQQDLDGQKAWVEQIDSVQFPDGSWRYRWWIKSNYTYTSSPAEAIMIEGMGYTTGLRNDPFARSRPLIAYTHELICFNGSNQWLYHVPNQWNLDCEDMPYENALSVQPVSAELQKPLLYPNPVSASGNLHINSYAGSSACYLEAYDLSGKRIVATSVTPGNVVDLVSLNLQPGLYFFRLSNSEKQLLHTQKVMIA